MEIRNWHTLARYRKDWRRAVRTVMLEEEEEEEEETRTF
jgi:hypothetical protein